MFLGSGPKTSLIEARASYEPVGRKGSPLSLSLTDTQGISDNFGAGGRGSFVPSKMRAVSLSILKCWQTLLEEARARHLLREQSIDLLAKQFSAFQATYDALMEPLSKNALTQNGIVEMVQAYRTLVLTLCELPHESIRRQRTVDEG